MTKRLLFLFAGILALCAVASAQTTSAPASGPVNLAPIAAGLGMAIASGLCGLAQGKAVAARWKAWRAIREPPRLSS